MIQSSGMMELTQNLNRTIVECKYECIKVIDAWGEQFE